MIDDKRQSLTSIQARAETLARLHSAKDLGFNLVHIVPPGGYEPYTFSDEATEQFEEYLDLAQSLGLWLVYDMRNSESTM